MTLVLQVFSERVLPPRYKLYADLTEYLANVLVIQVSTHGIRPLPIMLKILPIMLLSSAQKISLLCS